METYRVIMLCRNCDYEYPREMPKGEEPPVITKCPNCGCLSAWKKELKER